MSSWLRLSLVLALRGVRHPSLAVALVRAGWRFRRRHWWRRAPFLPLPSTEYLHWRMHTAYGEGGHVPAADDVVRYARWAVSKP